MNLYSVFCLFLTVLGIIVTWNSERNFFDVFPFLPTMAITFTSSELIRLNDRLVMLPSDTFLRCAGLGILRRLRYIHHGAHSTRRTRSTMTAIPANIPVILSNERPSRRRCLSPCGVNLNHLRSLSEASQHDFSSQESNQLEIKMALLNARSVLNKTFLLNDFFLSNNLDFLFITETWLTADDLKSNHFYCHITSALVSEILTSVLQTVQKKKKNVCTDCTEDNVQNTHTYTQYTQCTIKTYLVIDPHYTLYVHIYIMYTSIHSIM